MAYGGLLDEFLAEDDALVAPFEAFFDDGAHLADHAAGHHEALVVEVGHWWVLVLDRICGVMGEVGCRSELVLGY